MTTLDRVARGDWRQRARRQCLVVNMSRRAFDTRDYVHADRLASIAQLES